MSSELALEQRPLALDVRSELAKWTEMGLVPREISPEDAMQTVTLRHNALTGHFEVRYDGVDGVQVLGLLASAMEAIWKDTFHDKLRPALNSGDSMVAITLLGEQLKVVFGTRDPNRPEERAIADVPVAKGLLVATLFGLCGEDFNPMDALTSGIAVPRNNE